MKNSPSVSVLLPVRNGMPYLPEAVESILKQSYDDFEFVVVNDGSSDDTLSYLNSLQDVRLNIITTEGVGLVNALNLGLQACSGKYLVRMDADDISQVDRIATQFQVMEADKNLGVVCSNIIRIDEAGNMIGSERSNIKTRELLRNGLVEVVPMKPIVHPSVMIRTALLKEIGGYRNYHAAEDRDLWLRLVDLCLFQRIQTPLLKYRVTTGGVSRMQRERQATSAMLAILNYEVHRITGFDLYQSCPDILEDIQRICSSFINEEATAVADFQAIKSSIKSGQITEIIRFLGGLSVGRSIKALPFTRRRAKRRLLDQLVFLITQLLLSIRDMPLQTFDGVFPTAGPAGKRELF